MGKIREYQKGFYNLSERVRDPVSRRAKAEKIIWSLTRFAGHPLSSKICLDVGCSSGIITSYISQFFRITIGLDYDEIALKAINRYQLTKTFLVFIHGDAMALPVRDESIDVVICAQVYEHVPDDRRLFDEIYRVLRPGGIVFFSGPNWLFPIEPHYHLPFLHWLPRTWADRYLKLMGRGQYYYENSRHFWELRRLLHKFKIVDISTDVIIYSYSSRLGILGKIMKSIVSVMKPIISIFAPNFNWILLKSEL